VEYILKFQQTHLQGVPELFFLSDGREHNKDTISIFSWICHLISNPQSRENCELSNNPPSYFIFNMLAIQTVSEDNILMNIINRDVDYPLKIAPTTMGNSIDAASHSTMSWCDIPCEGNDLFHQHPEAYYMDSACTSLPSPPPDSPRSVVGWNTQPSRIVARKQQRRVVSFAPKIHVRVHETILGDHPTCTGRFALDLGWNYNEEEWDLPREEDSSYHKDMAQLRMSFGKRSERLRNVTGLTTFQLLQEEYQLLSENSTPVAVDSSSSSSSSMHTVPTRNNLVGECEGHDAI
jgi:hypothetical protein